MRYAVVIEKAEGNYSAYVPDLPGCVATGATVAEVETEIRDAIAFHLEGMREDGVRLPEPSSQVEYIEVAAQSDVIIDVALSPAYLERQVSETPHPVHLRMLPNAQQATFDPSKVRAYLLSPTHPIGHFKAVVFNALGYTVENWPLLVADLVALARTEPAIPGNAFTTVWMLKAGDPVPRFVTATPEQVMYKLLDTVALTHDMLEVGLRRGDLGAVVEVHAPDAWEVEFVAASGRTQALVTLTSADLRHIGDQDAIAVRSLAAADA